MTTTQPVTIYEAWNSCQAQLIRNLLADAGIDARIASDALLGLVGKVPFQHTTCPVWVDATQAAKAQQILAKHIPAADAESHDAEFCYHCGQPADTSLLDCPTCGEALDWTD